MSDWAGLLSVEEAAARIPCKPSYVYTLIQLGHLEAIKCARQEPKRLRLEPNRQRLRGQNAQALHVREASLVSYLDRRYEVRLGRMQDLSRDRLLRLLTRIVDNCDRPNSRTYKIAIRDARAAIERASRVSPAQD